MTIKRFIKTVALVLMALCVFSGTSHAAKTKYKLGLTMGSEATYGNGLSFHMQPWSMYEINFGAGINSSGLKIGAGNAFVFEFMRGIGMHAGAALVFSGGTDGEVTLDAKFTPEDSNKEEDLEASKDYELSPGMMFNLYAGGYWHMFKWLAFNAQLCFNTPISGNEVTLDDKIRYDRKVEVTNEKDFDDRFDSRAEKDVKPGGLGVSVGAQIVF